MKHPSDATTLFLSQANHQSRNNEQSPQDSVRLFFFKSQVYLDAVPLIRPNEVARVIEGEPLLVMRFHAFNQFIIGDRKADSFTCSQQLIDRNPSPRLECQSQSVRGMAQVLCQELADRHQAAIHRFLLFGRLPRMTEARSSASPPRAVVVAFSAWVNPGTQRSSSPSTDLPCSSKPDASRAGGSLRTKARLAFVVFTRRRSTWAAFSPDP